MTTFIITDENKVVKLVCDSDEYNNGIADSCTIEYVPNMKEIVKIVSGANVLMLNKFGEIYKYDINGNHQKIIIDLIIIDLSVFVNPICEYQLFILLDHKGFVWQLKYNDTKWCSKCIDYLYNITMISISDMYHDDDYHMILACLNNESNISIDEYQNDEVIKSALVQKKDIKCIAGHQGKNIFLDYNGHIYVDEIKITTLPIIHSMYSSQNDIFLIDENAELWICGYNLGVSHGLNDIGYIENFTHNPYLKNVVYVSPRHYHTLIYTLENCEICIYICGLGKLGENSSYQAQFKIPTKIIPHITPYIASKKFSKNARNFLVF